MKRVSALVLLAAIGGNAFCVDGKALNQKPIRILPQAGRPETSLNQYRWDRDYRDNTPVGGRPQYRQYQNNDRRSFGTPTPKSTEEGWWNEERRNYKTSENRMDRRSYSNARNKGPISNNYDVTPDEWRGDDQRQYYQQQQQQFGGVGNQRQRYYDNRDTNRQYDAQQQQRQTLRANDRDSQARTYNNGYQQENYDPNDVTPQEWKDQQQRQPQGYNNNNQNQMYNNQGANRGNDGYYQQDNGYSYGFGARGEVIGTYDQTVAYNTINNNGYDSDPTPPEWKDKQRQNGRASYNGYDQGYRGADGLHDPTGAQGSWWNEERRDYSTNLGRQETRSYGAGSQTRSNDIGSVRPSEWEQQYDYNVNNRNQRPVVYDDRRGGDRGGPSYRPKNNWWDSVKNGFRNVSNNNSNNNRRDGYNGRREYVTQEDGYFDNSYNGNYNNDNYSYNNNNNRRDYVTQDNDWWKQEKVDTTTW